MTRSYGTDRRNAVRPAAFKELADNLLQKWSGEAPGTLGEEEAIKAARTAPLDKAQGGNRQQM